MRMRRSISPVAGVDENDVFVYVTPEVCEEDSVSAVVGDEGSVAFGGGDCPAVAVMPVSRVVLGDVALEEFPTRFLVEDSVVQQRKMPFVHVEHG